MDAKATGSLAVWVIWQFLVGCGQTTGHSLGGDEGQSAGSQQAVGSCSAGAAVELIDDMEDNDASILGPKGRSGYWFSANDKSGVQVPEQGTQYFPMWRVEPARETSLLAVHTSGSGFTTWGAQIGFDLAAQKQYDASAYAGIVFWARGSAELGEQHVRVNVTDVNTAQFGDVCDIDCGEDFKAAVESGHSDGICDSVRGPCHDYFGADFGAELGPEWREFRYTWDQLATRDWSNQHLTAIAPQKLYGLRFQADPSRDFDFWVDDIAFICR